MWSIIPLEGYGYENPEYPFPFFLAMNPVALFIHLFVYFLVAIGLTFYYRDRRNPLWQEMVVAWHGFNLLFLLFGPIYMDMSQVLQIL